MTTDDRGRTAEMPTGLRAAYVRVLAAPALIAPLALFWTEGASVQALALYEAAVAFLWWRAVRGDPVRLSDRLLNVIGLSYFVFLAFEVTRLRPGILRSVSHLLLFTAIAKLASLKRPGEARTALLVLFLLTLASASSSTHVSSLVYFAAMAILAFRTLCRLAVLADFEDSPPERVLRSVPTGGLALTAIALAAAFTVPLFYALPRLHSPFATAPLRLEESLQTALTADRVELESFSAAKRSDRVILSMDVDPSALLPRVLRLRESVFTVYHDGAWTRAEHPWREFPDRREAQAHRGSGTRAGQRSEPVGSVAIDLNLFTNGFLFLPYGATGVKAERGSVVGSGDGVLRASSPRRSVRYSADVRAVDPRGFGSSTIDSRQVPVPIRDYALRLTGDTSDPREIYNRIQEHLARNFVYTLDPPHAEGDPVVQFLLRSKAGHCEYFASAAALMLSSRGIPARLVTGSYGGEVGLFSRSFVVRGANLHAWVEADLDGSGFSVLDPTPPAGLPAQVQRASLLARISSLGREIEFFYDRRILGFDSIDQVSVFEAARQTVDGAAAAVTSWKIAWGQARAAGGFWVLVALAAAAVLLFLSDRWRRRPVVSEATKAYLSLRSVAVRRVGSLSDAVPPAEVARRFASVFPEGAPDAAAIVRVYCADAFGGREPDRETLRDITERLRRLKKMRAQS